MVEPTGDPTTLKKEERAMRPTPEVVRKWSSGETANAPNREISAIQLIFDSEPSCQWLSITINSTELLSVQCTTLPTTAYIRSYQTLRKPVVLLVLCPSSAKIATRVLHWDSGAWLGIGCLAAGVFL